LNCSLIDAIFIFISAYDQDTIDNVLLLPALPAHHPTDPPIQRHRQSYQSSHNFDNTHASARTSAHELSITEFSDMTDATDADQCRPSHPTKKLLYIHHSTTYYNFKV
jgi:hypothetical protein